MLDLFVIALKNPTLAGRPQLSPLKGEGANRRGIQRSAI